MATTSSGSGSGSGSGAQPCGRVQVPAAQMHVGLHIRASLLLGAARDRRASQPFIGCSGASNVSKLLSHVPAHARPDTITTIAFEAHSRIKDPIYGCVSHVLALQQQVEYLQDQVMQMRAQLEQNPIDDDPLSRIAENQWTNSNVNVGDEDVSSCEGYYSKQRPSHTQLSELQELALRMMNNKN